MLWGKIKDNIYVNLDKLQHISNLDTHISIYILKAGKFTYLSSLLWMLGRVRCCGLPWTWVVSYYHVSTCIVSYIYVHIVHTYILCNWLHVIIYHINVLHHLAHLVPSPRHQGIYNIHRVVTRPFQYKPGIFYIWNELIQRWNMSLTLGKGQHKIIKT